MVNNIPDNISDFTAQLDYSIEGTEERLAKLHDILEVYDTKNAVYFPAPFFVDYLTNYFNPHITQAMNLSDKLPVCVGLSYMAGYILFNRDNINKDIIKEKTQKYRDTKHVSLEDIMDNQGEESLPQSPPPAQHKQIRPTISEQDRREIPPLVDLYKFISSLASQMEAEEDSKEKFRLKKILIEARQDQYAIKEAYKPTIRFKSPTIPTTEYAYDEDTRYKRQDGLYQIVSRNTIDFSNPKHIYQLLNHYAQLRHQHYDNPHSDMRYVLDSLEEYIEKAEFNELYKFILIRRVDGLPYGELAAEIKKKFCMDFSVSYLSYLFVNDIPKRIVDVYIDSYEKWYYTYAEKGDYKTCSRCKRNKLRDNKYFGKEKKSEDGLTTICKECRRNE
jgi:hypothetical protein